MNSLKQYLAERRKESAGKPKDLAQGISSAVKKHDFKTLLFLITELRESGIDPASLSDDASFFSESNLFFMGGDINGDKSTYGADPEFILCDSDDNIVLYSSKYRCPSSNKGEYSMSSLAIGADYGLLELRPNPSEKPKEVAKNVKSLITEFDRLNKELEVDLHIKETEAVSFLHKIERMRQSMEDAEGEIDYGSVRMKMAGVTAVAIDDVAIAGAEYYGTSLTAYENVPGFTSGTDKVLTAGGHLHFGGSVIKVLSMKQLKALVRKLDERLVPIAAKAETEAAVLRRKYYGIPGEFRLKPYGFEYRVLSCAPFWKGNNAILKEILTEAHWIITQFDFKEEVL